MSQTSNASESRDFQLVAFCEQTGCRFRNPEIPKIRRIGAPHRPRGHTPRDPPCGKTGGIVFIGYVIYRKITSDLSLTCRRANRPNVRTTSMSSDASKSRDFKLVAFCEQTGCRFCGFDGAPLRPPSSDPPSANRAKRTGSEFGMTVSLKTFTSVGLKGECPT